MDAPSSPPFSDVDSSSRSSDEVRAYLTPPSPTSISSLDSTLLSSLNFSKSQDSQFNTPMTPEHPRSGKSPETPAGKLLDTSTPFLDKLKLQSSPSKPFHFSVSPVIHHRSPTSGTELDSPFAPKSDFKASTNSSSVDSSPVAIPGAYGPLLTPEPSQETFMNRLTQAAGLPLEKDEGQVPPRLARIHKSPARAALLTPRRALASPARHNAILDNSPLTPLLSPITSDNNESPSPTSTKSSSMPITPPPSSLPRLHPMVLDDSPDVPLAESYPKILGKRIWSQDASPSSPSPLPPKRHCLEEERVKQAMVPPDAEDSPSTFRTFPTNILPLSEFKLFYRRFPRNTTTPQLARSYPGSEFNGPRSPDDLYTPRLVKGVSREKVGMCPICIEPPSKGGSGKALWLAMKFSAFKCYHMQHMHGISAVNALPFSPPVSIRVISRAAKKNEKTQIKEGKCHKCSKWVPMEGIKDVEVKIIEKFWWKHAAQCHQGSRIAGEGDVFEE